jgi:hypothetical protein
VTWPDLLKAHAASQVVLISPLLCASWLMAVKCMHACMRNPGRTAVGSSLISLVACAAGTGRGASLSGSGREGNLGGSGADMGVYRSSRRKAWASWWPARPVPRVLHGSSFNAWSSPAYDDLRIIVEAATLFHSFNEFSLCSKMIPTLSIDVSGRTNLQNDIIQMCLVASLALV